MPRIALKASLLAAAAFAAGVSVGPVRQVVAQAGSADAFRQLELFGDVYERVRAEYVEEVPDQKLIEAAINGMLTSLDPHSSYLDPEMYRDMQVQTRGEFGGLGLEVTMENGLVKVVSPIDDTPASKAGVQPGDFVTHIDGEAVMGMSLSEAVEKMRGPVDSKIDLRLLRKGRDEPFDVSLNRAVIKISPVRARVEGEVAYVRLTTFNERTEAEMHEKLDELTGKLGDKLTGIVLDLRNNPGGLLDQAVAVADAYLDKGEIVSTRGRRPDSVQRFELAARRRRRGRADGGADQRRLRLGLGDRGRRLAGPAPGDRHGHPVVRQGLGPDDHAAVGQRRHPADHRALLHAGRPLDPGARHRARHRGPPGQGRDAGRRPRSPRGGPPRPAEQRPVRRCRSRPRRRPPETGEPVDGQGDHQLSRALDLLRGLALYEGRAAEGSRG